MVASLRQGCLCCLLAIAGCGSPVVESPRGKTAFPMGPQGPARAPTTTTVDPGSNLPRIPVAQIVVPNTADQAAQYHEVQAGETLTNVAARYRVSVEQLQKANGLDRAARLTPGQLIYIPPAGTAK